MLTVLDLFSGIGGFSLGFERAGMKTVAFCEIDPFCRRVLAKHWPDVPCHEDITKLRGSDVGPVDVVCGGPPCQPISSASRGRRKALDDDRWLWPEMGRLVAELDPDWVILENTDDLDGLGLDQIASNLEAMGHEVLPLGLQACSVGLDHIRPRCWVVSNANRKGKPRRAFNAKVARVHGDAGHPKILGTADGISGRMDRHQLRALGNSVPPFIPELIGRAIIDVEKASDA